MLFLLPENLRPCFVGINACCHNLDHPKKYQVLSVIDFPLFQSYQALPEKMINPEDVTHTTSYQKFS